LNWKNAKVEEFKDAGHDIQTENYDRFVEVIKNSLEVLD